MKRSYRLGISIACLLYVACSIVWADSPEPLAPEQRLDKSPRHHQWEQVETKTGRKVRAFVVFPEVDKPVPAVVVIHENRGLNAWARSLADQVAEMGYVAVAPDLLSGSGPNGGGTDSFPSEDAAREAIYKLSDEQVQEDLSAVIAFARKLEATGDEVAVAGFCWGGGQTFRAAAHQPDIAAACVFYGSAPDEDVLKNIKVPVHGFYGGNDFRITGQVPKVEETMKKLGKTYEPVTYKGAGHGFMRSGESAAPDSADREARNQAWTRWRKILGAL